MSSLEAALRDHEARINQLRAETRFLEEEIALHESIVALGRQEEILAAVGEFVAESDEGVRFAENPAQYCDQQGVQLPTGVTLSPRSGKEEKVPWVIGRVESGDWEVELIWDAAKGFGARPIRRPATLFPWLSLPSRGEG
jgi:hypothetical protein